MLWGHLVPLPHSVKRLGDGVGGDSDLSYLLFHCRLWQLALELYSVWLSPEPRAFIWRSQVLSWLTPLTRPLVSLMWVRKVMEFKFAFQSRWFSEQFLRLFWQVYISYYRLLWWILWLLWWWEFSVGIFWLQKLSLQTFSVGKCLYTLLGPSHYTKVF